MTSHGYNAHPGLPVECGHYLEVPVAMLLDDRLSAETKAVLMLMQQAAKHRVPFPMPDGPAMIEDYTGDAAGAEFVPVPCSFLQRGLPLEEITEVVLAGYNQHMGPAAKVRALFGTT